MRWVLGAVVALALVRVLALPVANSLETRAWDAELEIGNYAPGTVHRHRTEGYADTLRQPFGMHGVTAAEANGRDLIGIWGDSHVEGLTVDDGDKIASQVNRLARAEGWAEASAFGVGHGGSSIALPAFLMPRYEAKFGRIKRHYVLICRSAFLEPVRSPGRPHELVLDPAPRLHHAPKQPGRGWQQKLVQYLHELELDFLARFVRTLKRDGLRLGLGTAKARSSPGSEALGPAEYRRAWDHLLTRMRASVRAPIVFVYCPARPRIEAGAIRSDDAQAERMGLFREVAGQHGIPVLDAGPALLEVHRSTGRFPRGFANKWPTRGHLNPAGLAAVARVILDDVMGR